MMDTLQGVVLIIVVTGYLAASRVSSPDGEVKKIFNPPKTSARLPLQPREIQKRVSQKECYFSD